MEIITYMSNSIRSHLFIMGVASILASVPAFSQQPSPSNTGFTGAESSLTSMSETTIRTSGTVLQNFRMTGTLNISASNVTVRNFKITTSNDNCIRVAEGVTNVVIEDGECDGANSSGVTGEGFTARRLYIHNMGSDAFHLNDAGNVTIESNYITDLGYNSASHADGVQVANGSNITIRGNYFNIPGGDPTYNNSQIFMIKPDFGPINNLRIEGNWLNGGGYSVNMAGSSTNVQIMNNRFGKDYDFGPLRVADNAMVCGNVWDATGVALTGQTQAVCDGSSPPPVAKVPVAPTLSGVQ